MRDQRRRILVDSFSGIRTLCRYLIDVEYTRTTAREAIAQAQSQDVVVVGSYHDFAMTPSQEEISAHLDNDARWSRHRHSCGYARLLRRRFDGFERQPSFSTDFTSAQHGDLHWQLWDSQSAFWWAFRIMRDLRHYWTDIRSRTTAN